MIVVLEKYPTGWWRGQVAEKSGIFDSNKVSKLSTADAKKYLEEAKAAKAAAPKAAPAGATPAAAAAPAASKESPLKIGKRAAGSSRGSFTTTTAPVKGAPAKAGGAAAAAPGAAAAGARAAPGGAASSAASGGGGEAEVDEVWVLAADRQYVVCAADLTAHIPTHLQASKGEVIMVVQKYQTGWYRGVTPSGAAGIFDKKKVREATFAEAQALAGGGAAAAAGRARREKPTLYRVEAMFDYSATASNQLSLVEGEVVNILQEADKVSPQFCL